MKKILSILAGVALTVECFATGAIGVNPSQNGIISIVTNGAATLLYTNTFPYPFQSVPVVALFNLGNTNALPFTNVVTSTNFILQLNTPTNTTVAWQAFIGTPRIQSGTNATIGTITTNIPFAGPYAYNPIVVCQSFSTNAEAAIAVTAVTITNFTVRCNLTEMFNWISFGISPIPSASDNTSPGQNDVNY